MNAALICAIGLVVFFFAYRVYGRFLGKVIFQLKANEEVPSKALNDGVDYVPTPKAVLFGHHYSSIAGAAPIIGPAIAVVWGWLPAVIWIVVGTVLMGAVHDFSVLVLSMRHGGKSVGEISRDVVGEKARPLFLLMILVLVMVVIAVFARAIATLFIAYPGSVLPVNFQIIIAIAVGYFCYKRGWGLLVPSLAALAMLYALVFVGESYPLSLSFVGSRESQSITWVILLLIYSFVASVIPVWVLLQPRDYINSHQLFVGLAVIIGGLFISQPEMIAPAFSTPPADAPSVIPFLFVTIACGAISGFHGLVSSGTTSKQVEKATDTPLIGYGSMLGEGLVALLATLAVSAGIADWASHYESFAAASSGGIKAFVQGASTFVSAVGLSPQIAQVLIAVMVISFAATSLDTGVRIQRYILSELGEMYQVKFLSQRYVAGMVAVVPPLILCISGTEKALWPLFGATNQILAGLSLIVVTLWLYKTGRPYIYTMIPMLFILGIAGVSMAGNIVGYFQGGKYLLTGVGALVLGLEIMVCVLAVVKVRELKSGG